MSHRILWFTVAALALGGLIFVLAPSEAQRPADGGLGGMSGMPGGPQGMPGRYVVAHASAHQVLILDTMTGQVYRAREEDFKRMSDLPGMGQPGGGRDRPQGYELKKDDIRYGGPRDRRPETALPPPPPDIRSKRPAEKPDPRSRPNDDRKDARPRDRRPSITDKKEDSRKDSEDRKRDDRKDLEDRKRDDRKDPEDRKRDDRKDSDGQAETLLGPTSEDDAPPRREK